MQIAYYKEYSRYLSRPMEFKVYGSAGLPVLALGGRFYDWEERGVIPAVSELVESGKLTIFTADTLDDESFTATGPARERAEHAEQYFCYLTEELYPRIVALAKPTQGKVAVAGLDLGAAHALRLWMRRPQLFCGVLGMSGRYEGKAFFDGPDAAGDDLVLRCGCVELAEAGLVPAKNAPVILCAGQGAWEQLSLASTKAITAALKQAGITAQCEIWGDDVSHDWYWWSRMFAVLAPRLLG